VFAVLQCYLPFLPEGVKPLNDHAAIFRHNGKIEFFTASGPIYSCPENDLCGIRLAQGIIITQTETTPAELANALNLNRTTIYRNIKKYREGGARALIIDKGNRKAYKLNGTNKGQVQLLLNKGYSIKAAGRKVGISEGSIRYAIKKGALTKKKQQNITKETQTKLKTTSERSVEDGNCTIGIGAKRKAERVLASMGKIIEAAPSFSASEGVRHAGVLLALPALAKLGLLDIGTKAYGTLHKGFYGLRSVLLTLAFMALLRIKTTEQLKSCNPGELGIVLGLDRSPEMKTLRKKLKEMGLRNKAGDFISFLSKRWVDQDKDVIGFIYIDGHVRAYHGRKYNLPKTHVARRRLCMPATTDFWINDANSEPIFFVTAEANDSLLSMLDKKVIPELKQLAGKGNRVTLIFDREGWSPKSFEKWFKSDIDIITYRKGKYDAWPEDCFIEVESNVRGKAVKYLLGERSIKLNKNYWVREVRRLCEGGHQTSVITTRQDLSCEQVAQRMFFRWNQENFFRYMREEYALDHLVTNDVEPADVERLVPNPVKKERKKKIVKLKWELEWLKKEYGNKAFQNDETRHPAMRGFNIANPGYKKKILKLESDIEKSETDLKQIPDKIAIKQLLSEHEIIRLETERKMFTDGIKMICYRAETCLLNLTGSFYARNNDEGRVLLKNIFQQPADIIPDEGQGKMTVNPTVA